MPSRIRTTEELRDALKQKLDELKDAFKADIVTLHLYDPQRERLYFPVGINLLQEKRFMEGAPSMERVAGKVVRSGRPIIAEDAEHHPDLTGPFTHVERAKSAAGFPLFVSDSHDVIGVLFVDYRHPHKFEKGETERIQGWASEIAGFINQSLRGEQVLRDKLRMETDFRLEEARLQDIVNGLWSILGDVDIALWTQERGKRDLRIKMHTGIARDFVDNACVNLDTDIFNLVSVVFVDGKEVLIESPRTDPRATFGTQVPIVWKHMLAVPVSSEYHRLGVLCAFRRERRGFTHQERDLVRAFAELITVTIENGNRIIALNALHDVGVRLTLATDLKEILQEIVRSACQVIGADVATAHLYNPVRQEFYGLERSAVFPPNVRSGMEKPRGKEGLGTRIIKEGRIWCEDVDIQKDKIILSTFVKDQAIKAYVGTPLVSIDEPLGVLYVSFKEKRRFSPEDLSLIQILANYASTAIYRTELLDQRAAVTEIAREIVSTRDRNTLLQKLLEQSLHLLKCEEGSIALLDKSTGELVLNYAVGKQRWTRLPAGEGLMGAAAQTRQPVRLGDVTTDARYVKHVSETRSELDMPLLVEDELIGVLNFESPRYNAFSEEDEKLAMTLASQAAVALYNAELFQRMQERLEQRQILSEISNLLMEQRDVHKVLKLLMQKTLDSFDVDQGSFWFVDYAHHCVDLRFSIDQDGNLSDWYQKEAKISIPFGPGSIIGNVAVTGVPELWNDVNQCLYWDPKFDKETGYVTKRVLTVPILREQRATGVIQIVNPVKDSNFTDDEQEFLMSIASMAAIALYNAEMHEREMALSDIGRKLTEGSHLHEQEILQLIYQQAGRLMDTDNMYIALYDETTDTVRFGLAFKEKKPIKVVTRKAGKGRTEWIIRERDTIFIDTKVKAQAWYKQPGRQEYTGGDIWPSWMGVPMMVGEKVLGVIATYHTMQDHVYSKDDLAILQALASQAAIALDNARLYYDVNQRLQVLVDVGQILSSGIQRKESEILKLIYEQAQGLTGTRDMYVALYDEDTEEISFELAMESGEHVEVGIGGWATRKANMQERGKTEEIILTGKPILHSTFQESRDWYEYPGHKEFLGRFQVSYLGVPMNIGEKILGVLAIYDWEREYAYSESDLAILSSMASQAAIALDNAALYHREEKRRGQLETVRKIANTIAMELDSQVCMKRILDETITLLKAHYATIQLLDEATDELVIHAQRGVEGRILAPALYRIKIGEGITGVAAKEKRMIRVGNVGGVDCYLDYIEGTQSEMATPLIQHGKVIGVLNVEDPRANAFDQDDEDLFKLLAEEVVVAIQNAALFEEKGQALKSLREEQRKNMAAGRLTVANTIAAEFVHRMNNIAGTIPVRVGQIRELLGPSDVNYTKMVGYLDVIDQDVDGLLRTAQAIKASKTKESLELVDVGTLVSTALQRIPVPVGIAVHNRCDGNLPQVLVFSGQLVDVLENLIRNGIEAIDGSGTVTIMCRALVKDSQEWVMIGVEDTGHGIAPANLDRIFDLFYSTKPGGMGFALWRAKTLIESLGGRIEVSSEPGKGTIFTIFLPVEKEAQK